MAQENAKKFMELLNKDEELQKKVKAATEAYTGDKTDEEAVFGAVLSPIAKDAGYEFSFEDMVEIAKSSGQGEISDDEAAAVAGGDTYCFLVGAGQGAGRNEDGHCGACKFLGLGIGWFEE